MPSNLYFIRHGESEKNVLRLHSCSLEKHPLTPQGRADVELSAKKFSEKIDVIITSPQLRAKETAGIFSEALRVPVVVNDCLAEIDVGEWNDVSREKLRVESVEYQNYRQLPQAEKLKAKMGGHGESREEVLLRTRRFLRDVLRDYKDKNILIVAHGCTYAALEKILRDCEPEEYFRHEDIGHNDIRQFTLDNNLELE